jgi:hypothetical protein
MKKIYHSTLREALLPVRMFKFLIIVLIFPTLTSLNIPSRGSGEDGFPIELKGIEEITSRKKFPKIYRTAMSFYENTSSPDWDETKVFLKLMKISTMKIKLITDSIAISAAVNRKGGLKAISIGSTIEMNRARMIMSMSQ